MVRICVVHGNRWTRENVSVVAAVKSGEPIHYPAACYVVESAHCKRKPAGSSRHLGSRGGAGIELVDPDVPPVPIYYVEESVAPHGDPRKVGTTLKREPGRPSRPTVRRASDIGAPAQISEGHINGIAPRCRIDPVSSDVFLVGATSARARVGTHHGVNQSAECLAIGRGGGYFHAVAVGRTRRGTRASETRQCCVVKVPALSEPERAVTVIDWKGTRERKGLAAVV